MELEVRRRGPQNSGETGDDPGGEGSVDILFCMVIYASCLLAVQVSMKSCSGLLADTTHRFCYLNCDFLQPSHPRKNPGEWGVRVCSRTPSIMVAGTFFGNCTCNCSACDTHAHMCSSWTEMVSHGPLGKTSTHITQRCHLHMCIQEAMGRLSGCILFL